MVPLRKESPQWGCDRRTSRAREAGPKIGRSPSVFSAFFSPLSASFPVSTPPRVFAKRIFLPMLTGYDQGSFQGFDADGSSCNWRDWHGGCHGYEGLLVDNY